MSHFIKDNEGNYHEYSDEQYEELQCERARAGRQQLGCSIMCFGFIFAAIMTIFGEGTIAWLIGIAVTIIGAFVFRANSSTAGFVIVIILAILAYWGAYWLSNKIHSFFNNDGEKEKTEAVRTPVYNKMDEPIAVFPNNITS